MARRESAGPSKETGTADDQGECEVEMIARLSNPPVDSDLRQVLQMAAVGDLY